MRLAAYIIAALFGCCAVTAFASVVTELLPPFVIRIRWRRLMNGR